MVQYSITTRPAILPTSFTQEERGNLLTVSSSTTTVISSDTKQTTFDFLSGTQQFLAADGNVAHPSYAFSNSFSSGIGITSNASHFYLPGNTIIQANGTLTATRLVGNGALLSNVSTQSSTVTITSLTITDAAGIQLSDTALGEDTYVKLVGTGFEAGAMVFLGNTFASATTVISSTEVRARFLSNEPGTFNVYVLNTNGTSARAQGTVTYSPFPVWSAASGTLTPTTKTRAFSRELPLSATADSALTFSVAEDSALPPGTTFNGTTGTLAGNIINDAALSTTYTFDINATDAENQNTSKSFSITSGFLKQFEGNANIIVSSNSSYANTSYNATAIEPAGGFLKIIATSSTFLPSANVLVNNTAPISSTYISATEVRAQVAPASNGTLANIEIINTDGSVLAGSLRYNEPPTWVTPSALTEVYKGVSFSNQLEATGATSYANIAALPAGLTLAENVAVPTTFVITVVGFTFFVDGVSKPILNLVRGGVYTFIQSDATNTNHPIAFKDAGGNAYTTGVVSTGTPGYTGAQTVFTIASNAPSDLRYYCTVHGDGMGNTISVKNGGYLTGNIADDPTNDSTYSVPIDALNVYNQNASRTFSLSALAFATRKLLASDKALGDYFGTSVAFSEDGGRVVVGAPYSGTENSGAAYIYVRNGSVWTQEAKLTRNDGANVFFGGSVSITNDGSRALIGSNGVSFSGSYAAGAAYVFTRSGTTWTFEHGLYASDYAAYDYFGTSVSISGDGSRAVVGSPYNGVNNHGATYIYLRSGGSWTQEANINASGFESISAYFGYSVSISSDASRVVVTAYMSDPGGTTDAGVAYIYVRNNTTWSQEATLTASDKANGDQFGWSVSISSDGSRALVGARYSGPNLGAAYVYVRSGTAWSQEAKLVASIRVLYDNFGWSVSISSDGSRVLVGSVYSDINTVSNAGAAYVFVRNNTTWTEETKIVAGDYVADDNFGYGVSLSSNGSLAIIGKTQNYGVADTGTAYIFIRNGSTWSPFPPLFAFTSHTFTRGNTVGSAYNGPGIFDVRAAYTTDWDGEYLTMRVQGLQQWRVPKDGQYLITAKGAQGGASISPAYRGGYGRVVRSTHTLTIGSTVVIAVGQNGGDAGYFADPGFRAGGGGGGTFIVTGSTLLLAAGGGGGGGAYEFGQDGQSGTSGGAGAATPSAPLSGGAGGTDGGGGGGGEYNSGGAGYTGNGGAATNAAQGAIFPRSYANIKDDIYGEYRFGGQKSTFYAGAADGGFGGGGYGAAGAGGGGGYSGGGAGGWSLSGRGGGGGSYSSTAMTDLGVAAGNGYVIIEFVS